MIYTFYIHVCVNWQDIHVQYINIIMYKRSTVYIIFITTFYIIALHYINDLNVRTILA